MYKRLIILLMVVITLTIFIIYQSGVENKMIEKSISTPLVYPNNFEAEDLYYNDHELDLYSIC